MIYSIRHVTRFLYSAPVSESVMDVRMHPRTDGVQRVTRFRLATDPPARVHSHEDHLGNIVHQFSIPGRHVQLIITAEAAVEVGARAQLPQAAGPGAWEALDAATGDGRFWDDLSPAEFDRESQLIGGFAREINAADRGPDPLVQLREINTAVCRSFAYSPHSTTVHSPVDDALHLRKGVCQDFAHIMGAVVRGLGIPCRYVSGYLHHRREDHDRSEEDATHAWVEAWLPATGWIGFDPTNNLVVSDRHIRTAVGRDYRDVPPTRGVFRGAAATKLAVSVQVRPADTVLTGDDLPPLEDDDLKAVEALDEQLAVRQQQQQQQQ